MSDEARNVEILKAAYTRWSDTKGESVDDWQKICADDIEFGSLAHGAAPKVQQQPRRAEGVFRRFGPRLGHARLARRPIHRAGRSCCRAQPMHLALQEDRQDGLDPQGGLLAAGGRQGG